MSHTHRVIALSVIGLAALAGGCAQEFHVTLTISEDGTAEVLHDITADRAMLEQQVAMADRFSSMEEDTDDEGEGHAGPFAAMENPEADADAAEEAAPDDEAVPSAEDDAVAAAVDTAEGSDAAQGDEPEEDADAALARRIRKLIEHQTRQQYDQLELKIEKVEVSELKVRMVMRSKAPSLKALMGEGRQLLSPVAEHIVLDTTDEGKLRLTLSSEMQSAPPEMREAQVQQLKTAMAASPAKGSLTIRMPGKVISSTLGETDGAATSLKFDAEAEGEIDRLIGIMEKDIVIVSEPGGLSLEEFPLDSRDFAMVHTFGAAEPGDDLPIEDATEIWRAVPLGVTSTFVHVFDEGRELLGEHFGRFGYETSKCQISVRLHAPEGHQIMSLTGTRALKATDEDGNDLPVELADSQRREYHHQPDEDDRSQVQITLFLPLPGPGVEAIERLEGQAIVTTSSGWQRKQIERPRVGQTIDLAEVIEGASLEIAGARVDSRGEDEDSGGHMSGHLTLKVTGPDDVNALSFELKADGADYVHSYESHSTSNVNDDGETVREFRLGYSCRIEGGSQNAKFTLMVSRPVDLKRLRVPFVLEGIDLY